MSKTSFLALPTFLALCFWAVSEAQQETGKPHPIDAAMEKEMRENSSTAGTLRAIVSAEEKWDGVMNERYKDLQKRLPPGDLANLKSAQKAWLAFRDQEFALIERVYRRQEGTMYIPMRAHARMKLVKTRAEALGDWLEFTKEHQ